MTVHRKKKKIRSTYKVGIQFQAYDLYIQACSAKEAREKAYGKLARKGIKAMIDKYNSSTEKY